jgi:hypothetical protein
MVQERARMCPVAIKSIKDSGLSVARPVKMTVRAVRRRQISFQSGKALEVLGHAIEYLADEFALQVNRATLLHAEDPQVQSIQILMAASRSVYFECPIAPALKERFSRFVSRGVNGLRSWRQRN